MEFHIEYVPSAPLISQRALQIWWRRDAVSYLYYLGIPLLTLVFCLASDLTSSRTGNLFIGILIGIVATLGLQLGYSLLTLNQSARLALQRRGKECVHLYFNEEGVRAESQGMVESYGWNNFNTLWQLPTGWLLYHSATQYVSIPPESIGEAEQQFIIRKITEAGGKVTQ